MLGMEDGARSCRSLLTDENSGQNFEALSKSVEAVLVKVSELLSFRFQLLGELDFNGPGAGKESAILQNVSIYIDSIFDSSFDVIQKLVA